MRTYFVQSGSSARDIEVEKKMVMTTIWTSVMCRMELFRTIDLNLPANTCASFPTSPCIKLKIGRASSSGLGRKKVGNGWMKHKLVAIIPRTEWVDVFHSPTSIQIMITAAIVRHQTHDIDVLCIRNQTSTPHAFLPAQSFFMKRAAKTPMEVAKIQDTIIMLP